VVAEVTEGDGFTTETQRTRRDAGRRVCGNENGDVVTADRVSAQEAGQELVVEALQEQRVGEYGRELDVVPQRLAALGMERWSFTTSNAEYASTPLLHLPHFSTTSC
jgi:hypothetical protein